MSKTRHGWAGPSFEKKLSIVVVPILVAVIGAGVPLLAGRDGGSTTTPTVVVKSEKDDVPQFKGVAGHLEESRAVLDFLDQNDGEPVRLELGYPDVAAGDFIVENVTRADGKTVQMVTYVQLSPNAIPGSCPVSSRRS